jgi:phosphoglycolate phosphatase
MSERDYTPGWPEPTATSFLSDTSIEIIRPLQIKESPLYALFDFDGTLSLIREGWVEIMVPMMVEILLPLALSDETESSIEALVRDFVASLTGKQTIYQMMRLADEMRERGGSPLDPQAYKDEYHRRLMVHIAHRRDGLADGSLKREDMLVPGSLDLLAALGDRGIAIYIASGTDEAYVLEEAHLLGIDAYAPGKIYGAKKDFRSFSKEAVIKRILAENNVDGNRLIAFGDGYVEIADCKAVGGIAVGVASDEAGRSGKADAWKRGRLIGAGADFVIPDYGEARSLLDYVWNPAGRNATTREKT